MKVTYKNIRLSEIYNVSPVVDIFQINCFVHADQLSRGGQFLDLPQVHHKPLDSKGSSGGSVCYLMEPQTYNVWVLFSR